MTKSYRVQYATALTEWRTLREFASLERARLSAHSLDRCGGWVRIIDEDGAYVEGRTDERTAAMREAYFATRQTV